ncbi:SDR family NAD(P)-dependent oxidoreductase [Nocardioides sp. NPDC051685]|uniref:SDR family NAD(P)-dependent oxidoreductase n=1 Tax=Nocardioides sp. NPDC051685 TaxID=3364334 RepID=UPI003797F978
MVNTTGRRGFRGAAVVTGAGSGIGRSIAMALAARGLGVVVADVEDDAADAVAKEIVESGHRAIGLGVDVRDRDAVEAMADRAENEFGPVSVLVNNAGVTLRPFRASWDTSDQDFRWIMDVNFWGVVNGHMAFVRRMLNGSGERHIVNTASTAAIHPFAGHSAYSASKGAVDAFSVAVRAELQTQGIGVSVLYPGPIKTRITSSARLRPESEATESTSVKPWSDYVGTSGNNLVETADVGGRLPNRASMPYEIIDSDAVGEIVLDGIDNHRPYILTHPPHEDLIELRRNELIDGRPR